MLQIHPITAEHRAFGLQPSKGFLLVTTGRETVRPDDPPPADRAAVARHHLTDLTGSASADELGDVAVTGNLAGRDRLDDGQNGLDVGLLIGCVLSGYLLNFGVLSRSEFRARPGPHQPMLPGPPLNGPVTLLVTQPP